MGTREALLERIRAKLAKPARIGKNELDAVSSYIEAHRRGPRPDFSWPDLIERFTTMAEVMGSTVAQVTALRDVPGALARYLEERGLPKHGVCWPEFASLQWEGHGLSMEARPPRDADELGLTGAFCGIAETGTLALLSGPRWAAKTSLLPETHVAVLDASRIVVAMEEAWDLMRAELGQLPRAVNLVSGPSRTGDIEQTIVLGAHGPYRVHIILVQHF
jgi:L-lactate dehydrogenase complex protein LldG